MKGIIFSSFLDFVELQLGEDFLDEMIDASNLETNGAYTNVGTYPVEELVAMLQYILGKHDLDKNQLLKDFGGHTFSHLTKNYKHLVVDFVDAFDCIYNVDQTIHQNVLKLYPDAELPNMNATFLDEGKKLHLVYESSRPFMYVAYGLLDGCVKYYNDNVAIEMRDLSNGAGTHAEFYLIRDD
ncbi:MAG: heme NO-binding domain-containing protein [Acidiferrobacterales bacterium]|nr:heme NO-binding domain-containing protein [Acidiferrobacterales bacterium]